LLPQVPVDLEGNARPSGAAPDIGAFEHVGAPVPLAQRIYLPFSKTG
jgi:hypothetical protein